MCATQNFKTLTLENFQDTRDILGFFSYQSLSKGSHAKHFSNSVVGIIDGIRSGCLPQKLLVKCDVGSAFSWFVAISFTEHNQLEL